MSGDGSGINGNKSRRNGILHNEMYAGQLIYNRQSFRKDPDTGRRQAVPNPPDQWVTHDAPDLRIVPPDIWQAAQDIKTRLRPAQPGSVHQARRPKRLLSGLLTCGCCGHGVTIVRPDRYGCSAYREKGVCDNANTLSAQALEDRVIGGLRDQLLAPEAVAEFVREFHAEMQRRKRQSAQHQIEAERKLRDVSGRVERIVNAIAAGTDTPAMHTLLMDLERQRADLLAELEEMDGPSVLELHPNLHEVYRRKITSLEAALPDPSRGYGWRWVL